MLIVGGVSDPKNFSAQRRFEIDVALCIGDDIYSNAIARELWAALANVVWAHPVYGGICYSFRAAGDLVGLLRGDGTYLDWYCSADAGRVGEYIAYRLAQRGWTQCKEEETSI